MASHPDQYSRVQIALHWVIAILILFQLVINDGMRHAFDDRMDGNEVEDMAWALLHVGVGVGVLVLGVVRLAIRLTRGAPPAHDDKPPIINWFGYVVHWLLYGFIFAMPITGAIAWFGGSDLAANLHSLARLVLIPLIVLHIAGAFAEHFVFRNDSLMRMLRIGGPRRR